MSDNEPVDDHLRVVRDRAARSTGGHPIRRLIDSTVTSVSEQVDGASERVAGSAVLLAGAAVLVACAAALVISLTGDGTAAPGRPAPTAQRVARTADKVDDWHPAGRSDSTIPAATEPTTSTTAPPDIALPESGTGRRVVFSIGRQRMWWVDTTGTVLRTALVSGRPGTPQIGTFSVYSKSAHATGLDGSEMGNFVRFTKGPNGWAIGFHDIPTKDGAPVQSEMELGQALSHGCIRQSTPDAAFTWDFLQIGDQVVVVA